MLPMLTPFSIKGVNPGTGQFVEFVLMAESAEEAQRLAEDCGLEGVTLEAHDGPVPGGRVPGDDGSRAPAGTSRRPPRDAN